MNEQQTNQLFIFKRVKNGNSRKKDKFVLHKRIVLREIPFFKKVCMNYHFKIDKTTGEVMESLIFTKHDCIFELNYMEEDKEKMINIVYKFPMEANR